jgi:phenylalanyl-tRNA synthetase beta chain
MYDIGQPLHAFDADKVKGNLVVRAAREGEKIVLLDGRELTLTSADHVIADDEGALVVAGAKGGKRAEISQSTRRMIIESANFDPTAVRRTSTKYDIRSDSSKRFENEITPELASDGMAHISALIQELMPEARFSAITDQYPVKAVQTVIMFDPDYIKERLGIEVPLQEAKDILNSMDMVIEEAGKKWKLTVPFMRLDLVLPEDIVEEVGRIYGYDHIQGILPPALKDKAAILSAFYLSEKIKNVLVEHDFSEVDLYTLVAKGQIEVFHPLAKDKAFIRENLIDGMTACVEKNVMNADLLGLDIIRVFEIGHVFSKEKESSMLAIGVGLAKKIKGHKAEDDIKKAIEALNESLGISLSSPKIVSKGNMAVCEIDLDEAFKNYKPLSDGSYADLHFHKASDNVYKKISPYPFMVRDIAVFVPENIQAEAVWQSISQGIKEAEAEALLVRHALFDTFKKDGKVSYAFRMVFQSMDKTMTDDQANGIMEKIYAEMKGNSWEVR